MFQQLLPRSGRTSRPPRSVAVIGLVCLAAIAAAGCGDGGGSATTTAPATTSTTAPASIAPPTTSPPTTAPATSAPTTAAPVPTAPATTTAPVAGFPFTGDTVEVVSTSFTQPFVMQAVASAEGVRAFDGTSTDGAYTARCVAIVRDGIDSWNEWCGEAGTTATFVVLDGIDPWLVEVQPEPGAVTMTRQPSDWALVSNGCSEPIVSIVAAADLGPSAAAGVWCAGTEALVDVASVLLQPGPADGGRALLSNGAEGWNLVDTGTSLDCAAADGTDRCALFGSTGELPGGLPIPRPALLGPQEDVVGLRDVTDDVRAMAGPATDVGDITDAIVASLTPDDAEVPPTITFTPDPSGRGVDALAVEVPLLDDSTRASVHVVWISQAAGAQPAAVVRAFEWTLCSRGVADATTCI